MIDIEEVIADNGSMMRVWRYADAPELLKGLVHDPMCCDLVVAVPSEKLGILVDTPLMDWMFRYTGRYPPYGLDVWGLYCP